MLDKCKAIVIGTINYSENSVVLKCYTDQYGLQGYMINGVKSKKGSIKPSQLMPLTLLELEVYHQQSKNLHRIKELKCTPILNNLHFNLLKSSIGMFAAELIAKCLREENNPDKNLFDFLYHAIQILDITHDSLSNFPAFFMIHLSKYLGFFPKLNYSESQNVFSLHEGVFVEGQIDSPDFCNSEQSQQIYQLAIASFETFANLKISYPNRVQILENLVKYYQIHLILFGELKSPKVLNEVMI